MPHPSHQMTWHPVATSMGIAVRNVGASTINKNEVVGWDIPSTWACGHRGATDTFVIGVAADTIAPNAFGNVRRAGLVSIVVTKAVSNLKALASTGSGAAWQVGHTNTEWEDRKCVFAWALTTSASTARRTIDCMLVPWRV